MVRWTNISLYTRDPKIASAAVRDGNWDTLQGQQTWLNGAVAPLPNSC